MPKIFCLNKISPVGLKALPNEYEVVDDISISDAVMVRSAAMHEMELPNSVLAVARAGAGVNNIPLDKYAERGVVVFNTPGANANAVKELVIAMMLLAARDIRGSMQWVQENKGDPEINKTMEKAKSAFAGTEIYGKTLGVIGCGAIGALVCDSARKLGMKVVGVEPSKATIERYAELLQGVEIVSMDELLKQADYISIHVPLNDATRKMINAEAFAKMKDNVIIINAARDALVDDDALKDALESGKVRRYVTDFPNAKTANMDKVVAISHLGASTEEAEDNCAQMAAKELVNYIENGEITNSVNYPAISLGAVSGTRAIILHRAGLGDRVISEVKKQVEVKKFTSSDKGNYGATLLEIGKPFDKEKLLEIDGVVKVRII